MGPMTTAIRDEGTLVTAARAGDELAFAEQGQVGLFHSGRKP